MKLTESKIQELLTGNFDHLYQLTNSYIFGWESDYFGVTKSGYTYEIEIKISKSDFKADFSKTEKHRCLKYGHQELITIPTQETKKYLPTGRTYNRRGVEMPEHDYIPQGYCPLTMKHNLTPNRFYYAVPADMSDIDVPEYAGLISCTNEIKIIKQAPFIHKRKELKKLTPILLKKFYYMSLDLKLKLRHAQSDAACDKYFYTDNFEENCNQLLLQL